MKTRIIVAVIAIPILLLIIFFAPEWALGIVVGAIAACCSWEFMRATKPELKLRLHIYPAVCGFAIPFLSSLFDSGTVCETAAFLLFAVLFCELMLSFRGEELMDLEVLSLGLVSGVVMPVLLASIVRLGLREHGSVYVLLPFAVAFSSDSGAYFAGSFLGKHKLTPRLSPHKTIEGSIGGFVSAIAVLLIYGLVLRLCGYSINFAVLGAYGLLGSLACQLGDLSFSAVKRLRGIKDYGNLIPGHGGMLDRFDSMFWTAALVEILVNWAPAISR